MTEYERIPNDEVNDNYNNDNDDQQQEQNDFGLQNHLHPSQTQPQYAPHQNPFLNNQNNQNQQNLFRQFKKYRFGFFFCLGIIIGLSTWIGISGAWYFFIEIPICFVAFFAAIKQKRKLILVYLLLQTIGVVWLFYLITRLFFYVGATKGHNVDILVALIIGCVLFITCVLSMAFGLQLVKMLKRNRNQVQQPNTNEQQTEPEQQQVSDNVYQTQPIQMAQYPQHQINPQFPNQPIPQQTIQQPNVYYVPHQMVQQVQQQSFSVPVQNQANVVYEQPQPPASNYDSLMLPNYDFSEQQQDHQNQQNAQQNQQQNATNILDLK